MIVQVIFTLALMAVALIAFAQLQQLPLIGAMSICVALFGIYLSGCRTRQPISPGLSESVEVPT